MAALGVQCNGRRCTWPHGAQAADSAVRCSLNEVSHGGGGGWRVPLNMRMGGTWLHACACMGAKETGEEKSEDLTSCTPTSAFSFLAIGNDAGRKKGGGGGGFGSAGGALIAAVVGSGATQVQAAMCGGGETASTKIGQLAFSLREIRSCQRPRNIPHRGDGWLAVAHGSCHNGAYRRMTIAVDSDCNMHACMRVARSRWRQHALEAEKTPRSHAHACAVAGVPIDAIRRPFEQLQHLQTIKMTEYA